MLALKLSVITFNFSRMKVEEVRSGLNLKIAISEVLTEVVFCLLFLGSYCQLTPPTIYMSPSVPPKRRGSALTICISAI